MWVDNILSTQHKNLSFIKSKDKKLNPMFKLFIFQFFNKIFPWPSHRTISEPKVQATRKVLGYSKWDSVDYSDPITLGWIIAVAIGPQPMNCYKYSSTRVPSNSQPKTKIHGFPLPANASVYLITCPYILHMHISSSWVCHLEYPYR